ncbi:hypothetical protein V8F20_002667 [Naviculisporaceae sp. PSN 640]
MARETRASKRQRLLTEAWASGSGEAADDGPDEPERPPNFAYKDLARFFTTFKAIEDEGLWRDYDYYTFSGVDPAAFAEIYKTFEERIKFSERLISWPLRCNWSSYSADSQTLTVKVCAATQTVHDLLQSWLLRGFGNFAANSWKENLLLGGRPESPGPIVYHGEKVEFLQVTPPEATTAAVDETGSESSNAPRSSGSGDAGEGMTVLLGWNLGGKGKHWNIMSGGDRRKYDAKKFKKIDFVDMSIDKYLLLTGALMAVERDCKAGRGLPTMVTETGYMESLGFLRRFMASCFGLEGAGGKGDGLKIVLLVVWDGKVRDKAIVIERWEEENEQEGDEEAMRKRPVLKQWVRITRQPVRRDPNLAGSDSEEVHPEAAETDGSEEQEWVVTGNHGVDLILPFEKLFLRKPKADLGEGDLRLTADGLKRYAWNFEEWYVQQYGHSLDE